MAQKNFVHLHVHSEYSLLDGSAKIKELVSRTKELGMDSIALTDHGVMFGVIDFYKEAVANGIKPIIGCEVYIASGSRFNKENSPDNIRYHLVLLAENNEGYKNLIKLVSSGFTDGFYYKPRIDLDILREHSKGLICLSACLGGPIAKNLLKVSYKKALEQALIYEDIFGRGNFFLEIQDHGLDDQKTVNPQIIRMSNETGIPLVATNDLHYINKDDALAHEVLLCIQTAKTMQDDDRMKFGANEFYLKSPDEMASLFPYAPTAISNTIEIAKRCNVTFTFNEYKLPKYKIPEGTTASDYLHKLCFEGLAKRYGVVTDELKTRMDYELSVINEMGFVDYFLITWDFIKYANESGIVVGPGRGSAAGSIVAYSLKITNIDPIKYGLIFERFLNPERISMPDIDIDFCYERRQEVIDYVIAKYGADHVAQIITFGTMSARSVLRDVGRALAYPYANVDKIAKMVPFEIGITIERALKLNAELRELYQNDEQVKLLIDMAKRLEGLPRHASTHAAGVVICDEPVTNHVPLNANDGVVTTQFPMNTLEELGLLKMDFLGLRTLTVIQKAVSEIWRNYGVEVDIDNLDFADAKVFKLICDAKTEGVFQLESAGMKSFMKELQPECLEDIIAGISLYRPGPMDFIPKYIRGKRDKNNIVYTHEKLVPILESTYGCIVYQEQVMQIVRELGGYSLGRSDLVRRAMSKKKASVMEMERKNFVYGLPEENVCGCVANGVDVKSAEQIFDEMTDFAKYAFNKSHAAAYAVIGYQTAWLKVYYPVEFMAALMTSVMDSTDKVSEYIGECKKMNIAILPPDINDGFAHFSVFDKSIRFGLKAIKNVGKNTIESLVCERTKNGAFKSLMEFANRLETKDLNKRCVESLIKAGALDSLGGKRAQYIVVHKEILDSIGQNKKKNVEGQMSLFDVSTDEDDSFELSDNLPNMNEYGTKQMLEFEKEVLGIYVSGHPLSEYSDFMKKYVKTTSLDLTATTGEEEEFAPSLVIGDNAVVQVGGLIMAKSVKYTKNGQAMAFLTVEDLFGAFEVVIFAQTYEKYQTRLDVGNVIAVNGRASVKEDENTKVICNHITLYDENINYSSGELWLKIAKENKMNTGEIVDVLGKYKGATTVIVYNEAKGEKLTLSNDLWVNYSAGLIEELKKLLGEGCVMLKS